MRNLGMFLATAGAFLAFGNSGGVNLALDAPRVGMKAPDFQAVDESGKKFKLSDYRGKIVVLDFWGFW